MAVAKALLCGFGSSLELSSRSQQDVLEPSLCVLCLALKEESESHAGGRAAVVCAGATGPCCAPLLPEEGGLRALSLLPLLVLTRTVVWGLEGGLVWGLVLFFPFVVVGFYHFTCRVLQYNEFSAYWILTILAISIVRPPFNIAHYFGNMWGLVYISN